MNGKTHAAIGAGAMLGALCTGTPALQGLLLSVVAAGAALGPDLDHPGSTASRAMPQLVHKAVHGTSSTLWKVSATGRDKQDAGWKSSKGQDPYHRTLTHTAASVPFVGLLALLFTATFHLGFVVVVAVTTWWCRKLLPRGPWFFAALGGVTALAFFHPVEPWMVAWAVAVGWLSHVLADGCTKAGVPLAWPLKIRGKRWWRIRFLGSAVASGQAREWIPAVALVAALNVPFLLL